MTSVFNITIRPVINSGAQAAIELILPIQQLEFAVPITLAEQPDLLNIETFYHRPGGCFWGAFCGGELVGTIALINAGGGVGAIRKMFVKKEYRGKDVGVAAALLSTLQSFCFEKHIQRLYLGTVNSMEAAHRFYEKNGFVRIEKSALPPQFPIVAADNVFYYLNLGQ